MEIRGRKPGSEEAPQEPAGPSTPRSSFRMPAEAGPPTLLPQSPVPGLKKGRVRALDNVPPAVRTWPKLLACGSRHEALAGGTQAGTPLAGLAPSQGQPQCAEVGQD